MLCTSDLEEVHHMDVKIA